MKQCLIQRVYTTSRKGHTKHGEVSSKLKQFDVQQVRNFVVRNKIKSAINPLFSIYLKLNRTKFDSATYFVCSWLVEIV